jgi:hypothetical protein
MLNMAKDLGFFGIVWGILVLACRCNLDCNSRAELLCNSCNDVNVHSPCPWLISTALLGSLDVTLGGPDQEDEGMSCGEGNALPMQSWTLWWFIRTYLQSLGQVILIPPGFILSTKQ